MPRPIPSSPPCSAVFLAAILAACACPARAQVLRSNLWVTDGPVNAEFVSGNTLYLGGEFRRVGPPVGGWAAVDSAGKWMPPAPLVSGNVFCTAPDGDGGWFVGGSFDAVGTHPRANLARFDHNGNLTAWNPTTNGPVYALLLFAGRLYAGGAFTNVDGLARNHLAVVDTLSGGLGTWNPNADGDVRALTPFGSTFLIGGQFTHVSGFARGYLAGVDTAGTVWSWDPEPNRAVYAIGYTHRLVPNVVTVYVGGDFTFVGGQARTYIAALDATPGSATFGQATAFNATADNTVRSLLIMGTLSPTIYVGGDFSNIGGQPRSKLAALNGSALATSWNPGVGGLGGQRTVSWVDALALRGTTLYLGGSFSSLGGQARSSLGAVDTGTGAVGAWDPSPNGTVYALAVGVQPVYVGGAFTSFGGVARNNLAALDLISGEAMAWNPNADGPILALSSVGGHLYAGGTFANIGGAAQAYIAQLDPTTGARGAWAPSPNSSVTCIGGRAIGGGKSMIYFGGAFTSASGLSRRHLAAMSDAVPSPGLDAWNPSADTTVSALAVSGGAVFVGGSFQHVANQARANVASLDPTTGAPTAWNPGPDAPVASLATTGSVVYAGGSFANVAGHLHRGVAALDPASGSVLTWPAQVFGPVSALAATSGAIYVGGIFTNVGGATRTNLAALDPTTGAPTAWDPEPWTPLTPATLVLQPEVRALAEQSGSLYAGGVFATLLDSPHSGVAGIFEATTGVDPWPTPRGGLPSAWRIEALPNPFRSGVALDMRPPGPGTLEVRVYDLAGRMVRDLGSAPAGGGEQQVHWDGRDSGGRAVPVGVYLVRARMGNWSASGRVVRLR